MLTIDKQISQSISKTEEDWKFKRNERLANLKERYNDDDLVLFLGAGTSIDAKIATWDELISDLLVTLISNKLKEYNINLTELEKDLIIEQAKK